MSPVGGNHGRKPPPPPRHSGSRKPPPTPPHASSGKGPCSLWVPVLPVLALWALMRALLGRTR